MASKFSIATVFTAIDQVTKVTQGIGKSVGELGKKAESTQKSISESFKSMAAPIAAIGASSVAAGAAIFKLATSAQESADSVADTAMSLGISTKALQEYRYVAGLSGMATEDMDKALQKLTVNLGKGGDATESALNKLGLSIEQMKSAGPDQVLELVADGMKNIKDPAERAAIVTELFGKSSVRMVNALSAGSEGLSNLRAEAQAAGYVMDEAAISTGTHMGDSMDRLNLTFTGLINKIGIKVIPQIEGLIVKFSEGMREGGFLSNAINVLVAALTGIMNVVGGVVSVFEGFISIIEPLSPILIGIAAALLICNIQMVAMAIKTAAVTVATTAATVAQALFNAVMNANPIGLVCIAIGVLVAAIILMVKNWETVSVVLKKVGQTFMKALLLPINLVMSGIVALLDVASNIPGIGGAFKSAADGARSFQNQMNKTLTGTEGALDFGGVWNPPAVSGDLSAMGSGVAGNILAAGGRQAAPVSSNTTINKNTNSTVDINLRGAPQGTTTRQTGQAPGIKLNLGFAGAR